MRIEGKLHWLHVAGTEEATYYMPHGKWGSQAIDAIGILPSFEGIAVHDGWNSYFSYGCDHALCNAHHLRERTFVHEQDGQPWAKQMMEFLLEVKEAREKSRGQRYSTKRIQEFERRYRHIVAMGMSTNPPPVEAGEKKRGRKKKNKAANLLDRLRQHEKAVLAFMYDFSGFFNNNAGERDIRMMKVQQMISGTFRSYDGALAFCRIMSYISTVKKMGLNVMSAPRDIFSGNQLLPHYAKIAEQLRNFYLRRDSMGIVRASQLRIDDSDLGVAALRLVNSSRGSKTMTAGIATFQPGASIVWHTHPCEETVIVIDGKATAHIENSKVRLKKYDTTIVQANIPHRFCNDSDQLMTIAYFYPIVDAPRYPFEPSSLTNSKQSS